MDTSTFAQNFKEAHVRPLPKITSVPKNHLSNSLQSAYRKHHSTESALLKLHNDIIVN